MVSATMRRRSSAPATSPPTTMNRWSARAARARHAASVSSAAGRWRA